MTIKLVLLKSGEDVIADVKELIMGERVVGYTFINPATVRFFDDQDMYDVEEGIDIMFSPWIPLTSQKEIPVAPDWIITIVNPIPQLVQQYKEGIKNATSSEVPETSESGGADLASGGSEC